MIADKLYSVLLPKPVFVRLGVAVSHMPHEDVHERSAGIEVFRFIADHRDVMMAALTQVTCTGDACDTVSDDYNMHERILLSQIYDPLTAVLSKFKVVNQLPGRKV